MLTLAAKQAAHRKDRRSRGLCGYNGCRVKSGTAYHCDGHAAGHAARMQLARQKAKAA